jgi:hypothetical protein
VTRWSLGSMIVLVALPAVFTLAPDPSAGQTSAPTYTPSRTRDGQPDLQGVWQVINTAAWNVEDHQASLGVPAGHGIVEGGVIPYQPAALTKRADNFTNRAKLDP